MVTTAVRFSELEGQIDGLLFIEWRQALMGASLNDEETLPFDDRWRNNSDDSSCTFA